MKVANCLIVILSVLCITGCKFDGSLRYEKYDLDASKSKKVSFNYASWSYVDAEIPPFEWIKISQNDGIVYIKLKGRTPRKYNFESPYYSSSHCENMEWGAIESETGDYISGRTIGVTPTATELAAILAATNNLGENLSRAIAKKQSILESDDEYKWHYVLSVSEEVNRLYKERIEQCMPMFKSIIPLEGCCTMLIHIGNTSIYKHSDYEGWYMFPIKERNAYWNPQFPPEKKSYF